MRFSPSRTRLLAAHVILDAGLLLLAGVCAFRLLLHMPDPLAAAALPGLVAALLLLPAFLQRTIFLLRARYEVTHSGALAISFGAVREILPLEEILEIRSGAGIPPEVRTAAPGWRTSWQGSSKTAEGTRVDWFATNRGAKLLLIVTASRSLAISPDRPAPFANLIAELSTRGSLEKIQTQSIRPGSAFAGIFTNRSAVILLFLSLLLYVGLGSLLIGLMPTLPMDQFLKFTPSGEPTGAGDPTRLLLLPISGGAIWLFNSLLGWQIWRRNDRTAAYALWIISLLVAFGLWIASIFLLLAR
jgi:hypothetical protein